jgi:hypothetical protein
MDRDALLAKCDELLQFLREQDEQPKLRRLIEDLESLRDRLRAEAGATSAPVERAPAH